MAASQEENRAVILDVNVGLPGIDEAAVMTETHQAPERNRSAAADRYLRREGHGAGHADL